MGACPVSDDVLTDEQMAAAPVLTDEQMAAVAPAPATTDDRGFFARAKDSIVSGARAVKDVGGDIIASRGAALLDPSKRHALERGIGDVVTLGYGNRLAARIGNALGDTEESRIGGEQFGTEERLPVAPEDPRYREAGQVAGSFLPNPVAKVAGGLVSKAAVPVAKALAPGTERILSKLAATRVVGPVVAPVAGAVAGAGRGIAQYEATAPAAAALSANAEGHRLEAAREAATDPAGLVMSGALGAIPPTLSAVGRAGKNFVEHATKAADEYIAKDIVGESKGASTPVARKQMARAAHDFPELIGRDEELRGAIAEARHGELPKVQHAVDTIQDRLAAAQADKPEVYRAIDKALPDSGVKMKDVVKAFKDDIHEWEHGEHGGEEYAQQIANKLKQRLATIMSSEAYGAKRIGGAEPGVYKPETRVTGHGDLDGMRTDDALAMLEHARKAGQDVDAEIAALKARATTGASDAPVRHEYDPEAIVSTRQLRRLATDAQNTAFMGEGGLNGTERYRRALDVAATPTKLLDAQLERARAGAPDAVSRLKQMDRDTHTLLAAKTVMDQRLLKAKELSIGAGGKPAHAAHSVGQLARQMGGLGGAALMATAGHHPVAGGLMAAATLAPQVQRAVTESAAKFGRSPRYAATISRMARVARGTARASDFVRQAVTAGLPAADARRIWIAAHPEAHPEATP